MQNQKENLYGNKSEKEGSINSDWNNDFKCQQKIIENPRGNSIRGGSDYNTAT